MSNPGPKEVNEFQAELNVNPSRFPSGGAVSVSVVFPSLPLLRASLKLDLFILNSRNEAITQARQPFATFSAPVPQGGLATVTFSSVVVPKEGQITPGQFLAIRATEDFQIPNKKFTEGEKAIAEKVFSFFRSPATGFFEYELA